MSPPSATQLASDAAKLLAMATWLKTLDLAAQNLSPAGVGVQLHQAALDADSGVTPGWQASNDVDVVSQAMTALDFAATTIYGGNPGRLQADAAQLQDIAARLTLGTVTAADLAWLQAEATYLASIDVVGGVGETGLQMALQAINTSSLSADALANGDTEGYNAIGAAIGVMTSTILALTGNAASFAANVLTGTVIPDVQAFLGLAGPVLHAPPGPPPGTPTGPGAAGGGGSAGPGANGAGTNPGTSFGTIALGLAAAAGVGVLAWKMRAAKATRTRRTA